MSADRGRCSEERPHPLWVAGGSPAHLGGHVEERAGELILLNTQQLGD